MTVFLSMAIASLPSAELMDKRDVICAILKPKFGLVTLKRDDKLPRVDFKKVLRRPVELAVLTGHLRTGNHHGPELT